ncbi:general secretion pathway protein [Flavobacterium zepuense]|uniref:General secretion pathway protein n=1 Tax=Flavobacterium zepuense TaxID=2593302 RepID=A0A552US29_9FLAO|nr:general secretion pathway protein [Flavobacterium zepuense]TRW21031.1 general secretion pathway protein [Flavobacterium zepuense]
MIDIVLKLSLIALLFVIFWQDSKERQVYWFLYTLVGVMAFALHARVIGTLPTFANSVINLILILLVVAISYVYVVLFKRKRFLNDSIGSGDLLLFLSLSMTFATVAFTLLFVFSLLFSLLLHMIFKNRQADKTVPLAGYMALFFAAVYSISFFTEPKYLFSY